MSVLRSLSTSYSASKFLPPADSSQQFFLLHYILLLFFSCLFLLRRPNISLLQIFSLFTYFPVFFTSADQMFCSQNALTEKIQTALPPCSISTRMTKRKNTTPEISKGDFANRSPARTSYLLCSEWNMGKSKKD